MKRWILALLAAGLLLGGCSGNHPEETARPTNPTMPPKEPTPTGWYVPNSEIEQQTNAAVKQYALEEGTEYQIFFMGEHLVLLYHGKNNTEMVMLSGSDLHPTIVSRLHTAFASDVHIKWASEEGLGYYDAGDKAMVFMDAALRELGRVQMPEGIIGDAWIGSDSKNVYYCMDTGVFTMNLQTGVSRMLLEQKAQWQEITGTLFDGQILRCTRKLADDTYETKLISASSGETVAEGESLKDLVTSGSDYFTRKTDGGVAEYICGTVDGTAKNIWPRKQPASIVMLANPKAVFSSLSDGKFELELYDLVTGKRESTIALQGEGRVYRSFVPAVDGGVWFVGEDTKSGEASIYFWDTKETAIEDEKIYSATHYTRENPDKDGLEKVRQQANAIGEKYGVSIRIWDDALTLQPEGYVFAAEYLVPAYERFLPVLDEILGSYPDGFFATAAQRAEGKKIEICLLRSVEAEGGWKPYEDDHAIQYWMGNMICIALELSEHMRQNFYHEMAHIIDSRVLSTTSAFFEWNTLNPAGFAYYNDYEPALKEEDAKYLEGDSRAFIDLFSMSFSKEDRARILEYASMPGNEGYFATDVMQAKLRRICDGIRKAFGLTDTETALVWEQYLK